MKLKDLTWPKRLNNAQAIVKFAQKISPIDEDEDSLLEYFEGCSAELKELPISDVKPSYDESELRGGADEYSKLPRSTQPPVIVNQDGKIEDGNNRFYAAKKRGDKIILAYVLTRKM
jgi:hypothetical protein